MGKATTLPPPTVYKDNPGLNDASSSSAVSLHTIDGYEEYSEEQPPSYSYTDEPTPNPNASANPATNGRPLSTWYRYVYNSNTL